MRRRRFVWFALLVIFAALALLIGRVVDVDKRSAEAQQALNPFYATPRPLWQDIGTIIRREPLNATVPGGHAERILYVSERADGAKAVSGGMVFIPDAPAPDGDRPVVAWEHGTLGMGDACVPSRSADPTADMTTSLGLMMSQGWIVVATDYVGLGTQGPNQYLVAQSEVRDVVNAVRAARTVPHWHVGTRYVTFGHSQGGHASIWTGHLGPEYAPELHLLGVAAAAPALDLADIASAQWNTAVGWVIGSDLLESWPTVYPELPIQGVVSRAGAELDDRLPYQCITTAGLEAITLEKLEQQLFASDPTQQQQWRQVMQEQTPPSMPARMPVFIAQGTADEVVLAWPNAAIEREWCAAGSTIAVLWLGGVNHQDAALVAGPAAVQWMADRFADRPAPRSCDAPTIIPATEPAEES